MKLRFHLLAVIYALTAQIGFCATASDATRPNILFVLTDDQRFDALGVVQREQGEQARFPWFKSPNMDRLASEGVRFRNAFVTSALCSPSRAAFLTGTYNHINGIVYNNIPFPTDSVTWATLLRDGGYQTGYVGKWHMGDQSGQRPGFDYSASYIGQGVYNDQAFEINGVSEPTKGWVDDVSTDYAIEFIRKNKTGPFALQVGYKSPHGPCTPPARLKKLYEGEYCRPAFNEAFRPPYDMSDTTEPTYVVGTRDRRMGRFSTVNGVDENLGRLLDTLDELGLAENTMVVFASDNGYYLGDHGLHDKRTAYEESIRIPLLVRFPRVARPGTLVDATVLNIDLAPTILDFAGLEIPSTMQGRSWRPLLEKGTAPDWREAFFYEYFKEMGMAPTTYAVRTTKNKLVVYPGRPEWTQLFDLKNDPYETKNLADNPELRQIMEKEFARQKEAVRFSVPADVEEVPTEKEKKHSPKSPKSSK